MAVTEVVLPLWLVAELAMSVVQSAIRVTHSSQFWSNSDSISWNGNWSQNWLKTGWNGRFSNPFQFCVQFCIALFGRSLNLKLMCRLCTYLFHSYHHDPQWEIPWLMRWSYLVVDYYNMLDVGDQSGVEIQFSSHGTWVLLSVSSVALILGTRSYRKQCQAGVLPRGRGQAHSEWNTCTEVVVQQRKCLGPIKVSHRILGSINFTGYCTLDWGRGLSERIVLTSPEGCYKNERRRNSGTELIPRGIQREMPRHHEGRGGVIWGS